MLDMGGTSQMSLFTVLKAVPEVVQRAVSRLRALSSG